MKLNASSSTLIILMSYLVNVITIIIIGSKPLHADYSALAE